MTVYSQYLTSQLFAGKSSLINSLLTCHIIQNLQQVFNPLMIELSDYMLFQLFFPRLLVLFNESL